MLDFRIKTFLKLCETRSYTNTAKILKMTQPSVTQHIKYLQNRYNCQLFNYEGKTLSLTEEGEYLRRQAQAMANQSSKVLEDLRRMNDRHNPLRFGCPKDLSESVVPRLLGAMMRNDEDLEVRLISGTAAEMIAELESGRVDFVLADGSFDNGKFTKVPLAKTRFSCWAGKGYAEELGSTTFKKMFREKLLIGEDGSGDRFVLDEVLERRKCEMGDFYAKMVCNSPASIMEFAASDLGICFGYDVVMESSAVSDKICKVKLTDFSEDRELAFFYLKENMNSDRSKVFFKEFKQFWTDASKSE
ncbi:MAG: LysR family transcriptional regulator [Oscillospiraceae bacterium]|nr:LysR family transcriptional regulator [Oscillospiraceae bacterium]